MEVLALFDTKKFYAKCIQGNVLEAIDYLKDFDNKSEDMRELEEKYIHRFVLQDEVLNIGTEDKWIQEILNYYYMYYISVLTGNNAEESEKQLAVNLAKTLMVDEDTELDDIEIILEGTFREKGYTFLGGSTAPYYGPYIWKTTKREDFQIELPDGNQELTVFFISDFLMLSWLYFATFGRHYAGGWAKEEGMYYVNTGNKEIDIHSDEFQVSFLKHEAQHMCDYIKYSDIQGTDLEYRAKLVELIYYPDTFNILEKFVFGAKDDKSLPHPYSEFLIIKGLSKEIFGEDFVADFDKWKSLESGVISQNALKLYMENEQALSKVI